MPPPPPPVPQATSSVTVEANVLASNSTSAPPSDPVGPSSIPNGSTPQMPSQPSPLAPKPPSQPITVSVPSPVTHSGSQNANTPAIPVPIPSLSRPPTLISTPVAPSSTARTPITVPSTTSRSPFAVPINIPRPGSVLAVPTNYPPATVLPIPSNPVGNAITVPSNAQTSSGAAQGSAALGNDEPSTSTQPVASTSSQPALEQANGPEDGHATKGKRKRKRSSTTTPEGEEAPKPKGGRGRRSRGPSLPPYDPTADPGEDIDPTVVTMASLCEDTGQGRVSSKAAEIQSNHAAWKQRNREKRARMRAIMEAKKYGRTDEEAELIADGEVPATPAPTPQIKTPSGSSADDVTPDFDYTQDLTTSRYNVQVRIGPNGETIIDEDSLVVNREEADDTANYTHVTESDHTKFVNSGTYGKRFRGSRWSAEETELFYEALSQFGENYELIAYVLPGRDRKSCKNKFKVEDKKNPARINYCLNNRTEVDIETLSRMTGKDFSGPVPEIRAPTPRPSLIPRPDTTTAEVEPAEEASTSTKSQPKRRRAKSSATDDGVVIVGDIGSVVPNFDDA
ncbi:hypothetical protein CC1G_01816 [Coprinopsis cinerea okayama7|uniref:Uncharacterized protein n=1 Tax=Coprinopsis cinerea (strain Okayama-7 / 130 / ATCC MYA-4618 / FGSC 9003) TaxID=240176 RepID=A8N2G3_COPC7|nr:hypothetical protein CC1G_01816 [Coprinopsis cinerea okayama7\|eukprot:XP_001829136.2 hypothetical protein CC1G_01816 [Coprinopsis cinerea okayama7\